MTTHTFSVPDMSCQHCIDAITTQVAKVEGTTDVTIDLDTNTVTVAGGTRPELISAIDEAGFDTD